MTYPKYKFETVGSFLPTAEFMAAKEKHTAGKISDEDFRSLENTAIRDIVERQLAAGMNEVTSGEIRRKVWDKDFYFGLNGIGIERVDRGHLYQNLEAFTDIPRITGRISYNPEHPFFEDFIFLRDIVGNRAECRQTIPSPADLYLEVLSLSDGLSKGIYTDRHMLISDISTAYRQTVKHFYALGCRHIQFDDTACGSFADSFFIKKIMMGGYDPETLARDIIETINSSSDDLPDDMEISIYMSAGEQVVPDWPVTADNAEPLATILRNLNADKFFLPFHAENTDTIRILEAIPKGRKVALGLISAHNPQEENPTTIMEAVAAAQVYVKPEDLSICPSSGFKMTNYIAKGLVYEDQWRKLKSFGEAI